MNLSNLYKQKEKGVKQILQEFSSIFHNLNFIKSVYRIYQFNDEPKFYQYSAELNDISSETDGWATSSRRAGGASLFSEDLALLKCLAETVERYSGTIYKNTSFIKASFKEVSKQAIDPTSVSFFSETQKKQAVFSRFIFNENTPLNWVWGFSLIENKKMLIPAQLIYHSYKFHTDEGILQIPISTGAAGGSCTAASLIRGIYEIVERDAFMISYLNKLPRYKVDLDLIKDERIQFIVDIANRYKLYLSIIDISTDIGISCYATLLIDKSGIGPAIQVGLKSCLDPLEAIIGSFQESLQALCWMRTEHEDRYSMYSIINPQHIHKIEERGMYWYPIIKLEKLLFWIQNKTQPLKQNNFMNKHMESGEELKVLLNIFKEKGYCVYCKDITIPQLNTTDYKILKVVIPYMQPLYLDERYKYLGGKRLQIVPSLLGYKRNNIINQIPHPFL